jgi:hypothetical protein
MQFSAFSPLNGGQLSGMYPLNQESLPVHLDAGEHYTRGYAQWGPVPYPPVIGHVDGFVPMYDESEFALWYGLKGSGFSVPVMNSQDALNFAFPTITGALAKTLG